MGHVPGFGMQKKSNQKSLEKVTKPIRKRELTVDNPLAYQVSHDILHGGPAEEVQTGSPTFPVTL